LHGKPVDRRHDLVMTHEINRRSRRHRQISDTPGELLLRRDTARKQQHTPG